MSQFYGNFPDAQTDRQTHAQGSIYRTLPPKEVGPRIIDIEHFRNINKKTPVIFFKS